MQTPETKHRSRVGSCERGQKSEKSSRRLQRQGLSNPASHCWASKHQDSKHTLGPIGRKLTDMEYKEGDYGQHILAGSRDFPL